MTAKALRLRQDLSRQLVHLPITSEVIRGRHSRRVTSPRACAPSRLHRFWDATQLAVARPTAELRRCRASPPFRQLRPTRHRSRTQDPSRIDMEANAVAAEHLTLKRARDLVNLRPPTRRQLGERTLIWTGDGRRGRRAPLRRVSGASAGPRRRCLPRKRGGEASCQLLMLVSSDVPHGARVDRPRRCPSGPTAAARRTRRGGGTRTTAAPAASPRATPRRRTGRRRA